MEYEGDRSYWLDLLSNIFGVDSVTDRYRGPVTVMPSADDRGIG